MRHLVRIEDPVETRDPDSGAVTVTWSTVHPGVYCSIEPVSVRDFIQSQAHQSGVTVRIKIRYIPNLTPQMRLVGLTGPFKDRIYNPAGFLEDLETGADYITMPCSEGVNAG